MGRFEITNSAYYNWTEAARQVLTANRNNCGCEISKPTQKQIEYVALQLQSVNGDVDNPKDSTGIYYGFFQSEWLMYGSAEMIYVPDTTCDEASVKPAPAAKPEPQVIAVKPQQTASKPKIAIPVPVKPVVKLIPVIANLAENESRQAERPLEVWKPKIVKKPIKVVKPVGPCGHLKGTAKANCEADRL